MLRTMKMQKVDWYSAVGQGSKALGQRGWKMHPVGGLIGLGTLTAKGPSVRGFISYPAGLSHNPVGQIETAE